MCDWGIQQSNADNRAVVAIRIDPIVDRCLDLVDGCLVEHLQRLICSGRIMGLLASPPCSTWSRARHVPFSSHLGAFSERRATSIAF